MAVGKFFEVEKIGSIVVLNLRRSVEEIEFDTPPPDVNALLKIAREANVNAVIVDCHEIDFLRSTALGFFVTLWKRVESHGGRMAFCNMPPRAKDILRATKLDRLWDIYPSREEAIEALEG
jgi:anti-anti-sigma factor